MQDNVTAYNFLRNRGATRLCHFTKTKSLLHILRSEDGILATQFVKQDVKQQNDLQRLDNATDYVCCSLQYPNSWYWRRAKGRDPDHIFREWVMLTIELEIQKERQFKYCPYNAAAKCGRGIRNEVSGIEELFSPCVGNQNRTPQMLCCCPTDDQAEILVHQNIPLRCISGIIVGSIESANNIRAILKTMGNDLQISISRSVCSTEWSSLVRRGEIPQETVYD